MATEIVISVDKYERGMHKLAQARDLAELQSLYRDVNEECTKLRATLAEVTRELLEQADALMRGH